MTAQERREKYTERLIITINMVFMAELRVNKDPGVLQRLGDGSMTPKEYIQLVAEEITNHTTDETIAAFFDERSVGE